MATSDRKRAGAAEEDECVVPAVLFWLLMGVSMLIYVISDGYDLGVGMLMPAATAEQLMRSRYCAYVLGLADYLLATWHASTRPASIDFEPGQRWLGLSVRQHRVIDADHAEVEFVARSRLGGRGHRLQERSRFVRERGRWYYVDGDIAD